jgi:CubicO group peptidase (beta-lactamase class C family)
MWKKIILFTVLLSVLFFGEIALTFSEKGTSYLVDSEEVAFSLKLENAYSDYQATRMIDAYVSDFIRQWRVTGASVAVTFNEELTYAKGFGFANAEAGEEMKPGHLFRIASVSKLITAAAVMKLYEDGQLDLDEKVFGPGGILGTDLFPEYADKRYEDIEVQHLLNHTAGWSRRSGDPMFNSLYIARKLKIEPPAEADHIITYALSKKLYYTPGTKYSYSNLGYAVLGRIIEVKTGVNYEDYVMMNVLKPVGIHDMHLGKNFRHEKFPNEVTYYTTGKSRTSYAVDGSGEIVPNQYGGNNIELLGPAGGWLASAPELIKLITALDGFPGQPDILSEETIDLMVNRNMAGMGLYGWRGNDGNGTWWRTGYLDGSTAVVVRQYNHVNWVILLNTSTYKKSRIQRYLSSTMFGAVNSVDLWPDLNLFMVDQSWPDPINELPENNPNL